MRIRMFYGEAKSLDLGKIVKGTYDAATKTAEVEFPEIIAEIEPLIEDGFFADKHWENVINGFRYFEAFALDGEAIDDEAPEWAKIAYAKVVEYKK